MPRQSHRPLRAARRPINLSRGAFRQLAAALGVATLMAVQARADWKLTTSDLKTADHLTLNTWTLGEGLSATDQSGKLVTFQSRDILSIDSGRPVTADASRAWKLSLLNGDTLYGDALGFSGKSLQFKTIELGTVSVPLKRVATLTAPVFGSAAAAPKKLPTAPDHDIVVFKATGDKLEGLILGVDLNHVQVQPQSGGDPTDIPLEKVDAMVFGGARPQREIPPLSMRVTFQSGTTYTASLATTPENKDPFNWSINQLVLKDAAGKDLTVSNLDRISRVEIVGGRVVYLTELDFVSSDQTSFLGTSWPAQINRNVLGQPMKIAHQSFDRGIGVHTKSTLVYDIQGGFDLLTLRVGLDDSAAPNGQAQASIVLDGKTIWKTDPAKPLKPGVLSDELKLAVKGGKRLELHADPAARLDVQGRVDWVNVALHRE
jgi:hypothetical protein